MSDASSAPVVTHLGPSSCPAMAFLHRQCFAPSWDEDTFHALVATPGTFAHGIIAPAPLAAFVLWRSATDEAEVLTIAVDPRQRRRRLASLLLATVAKEAHGRGACHLFCEVAVDNTPARALYAGTDFVTVGRRPAYYTRDDGQRIDALIVRRVLP